MTEFEISIYRLINEFAQAESRKCTFPQFLAAIGKDEVPLEEKSSIATLIHDATFQKVLRQVGTHLWIGRDHMIRIVDTLSSAKGAQEVGPGMCRLCLMDEDDHQELVQVGKQSFVHHGCKARYELMRKCRKVVGVELDGE
ncbi:MULTISPECIES: hypothetical protein [unclassified Pseudomonas]|uniref:Uncharacterized protein n=1 Tax=Pseudomonas sp. 13.2 TaxID=3144665 RepID=A0AAU7BEF6_9PSED|nr:hypothetical protein [Pseudomonas sp. SWI36]